ncbi:MAG: transglycosylase SLT domain-containing protein [Proteobacteria bacterium]|nr:transglycosylase SLT domain-containing protein [Pseudomonadota bacterium]MBU1231998.1 transglycosylase SLT domain-containing protein [Pseudomonadota bacterium]MBU1418723.1 transglycosylase SLT domain-containing protein [Pseudomonadota bacterium]MBU1454469.1 transglycosylase SLT domain-containing protein [Pseudomonadota bacterium]
MLRYLLLIATLLSCSSLLFPAESDATQLQHALNKYKNTGVPSQSLKRLSPYNRLINYYSHFTFFRPRHKVSPDFIRALILAESSADPLAVSTKGAIGLGQIIYSTGKQAAKELSSSQFTFRHVSRNTLAHLTEEDLFDPAVNILLTCYLISKYNYKFNGRIELVISAWNAGENLVILKKGHPAPYQETYNLIGKVNSYYIDLIQKRKRKSTYRKR